MLVWEEAQEKAGMPEADRKNVYEADYEVVDDEDEKK